MSKKTAAKKTTKPVVHPCRMCGEECLPNQLSDEVKAIMDRLSENITFIEGALGVDINYAFDPKTGNTNLGFPSRTSESGWFLDDLEFDTPEEATKFLGDVVLIIRIGRLQAREPYVECDHFGEHEGEDHEPIPS